MERTHGMSYQLVISGQGRRYGLGGDGAALTIGRAPDNDVVLDDDRVSQHHARVEMRGEQAYIVDLGSSNGTFVDGQLCSERELAPGQDIQMGHHRLALQPEHDLDEVLPDAPTKVMAAPAEPEAPFGWPEEMLAAMQEAQEALTSGLADNDRHATESACLRLEQIGQEMARLAENVRHRAGLVQMDRVACDVNELVEQAARRASPDGIELDLGDDMPQLVAHGPGLTCAVGNVVHAAHEATCSGQGRLRVSTRDRPQTGAVEIKVEYHGERAATSSSPTAVRLPTLATGQTLTDFGLATAQTIVEQHGGWLAAAPRAEPNTYFVMSVPYGTDPVERSTMDTMLRGT